MKKIIVSLLIFIIIILICVGFIIRNQHSKSSFVKVRVSEVAHSVFYAPQYLADTLGYFKEEGLDVDIQLANGADAVMASVLSGDADIGFCGTEATI